MGKGHWPKGRRRNAPAQWEQLRDELLALFASRKYRQRYCTPSALAKFLDVDRHTVQAWLSGKHWPDPKHLPKIRAWLRSRQQQ